MKQFLTFVLTGCLLFVLCSGCKPVGAFTEAERAIIGQADSLLYVTTVPGDSAILRTPCKELSQKELESPELQTLLAKMLHTVTDPSQDGVGIAAPQVGLSRRIILVQRLDKPGEPFESYVNVRIDSLYGETVRGQEGCLSIPGLRGIVPRAYGVVVSYAVVPGVGDRGGAASGDASGAGVAAGTASGAAGGTAVGTAVSATEPGRRSERVEGFTARIFQHECDHLDGILYTDRADTLYHE